MNTPRRFTIVLQGVDGLPNQGIIMQTVRDGIEPLFRAAGRRLDLVVDRGIEPKTGDLRVVFDRSLSDTGPGTFKIFGSAPGRTATVNVDEHRSTRLGGGIRSRELFQAGRKRILPDYITRDQTLFEYDDPGLARHIGNTAVHEIAHMLGADHSTDPADVMYQGIPRAAQGTPDAARRFWGTPHPLQTQRQRVISNILSGNLAPGGMTTQHIPWGAQGSPGGRTTLPVLRRGSRGTQVAQLQRQLGVSPDGMFGPRTAAAVRDYQRRNNLRVDGIVGAQTRSRLLGALPQGPTLRLSTTPPTLSLAQSLLRQGSRGTQVAQLQRQLGVSPDGMFGPRTAAAVRDYQRRNNLRVDGIVGAQTRSRLLGALPQGPTLRLSTTPPTLSLAQSLLWQGSRGTQVAQLQRQLGVSPDGMFGPRTAAAVRDYQRRNNLRVDGIVGAQTFGHLQNNPINNPLRQIGRGLH